MSPMTVPAPLSPSLHALSAPTATFAPLIVRPTISAVNDLLRAPDQILLNRSSRLANASLRFDDADPWRLRSLSTSSLGVLKQTASAGGALGGGPYVLSQFAKNWQ